MGHAANGSRVMLADRVEVDVANDDHLAMVIAVHSDQQLGGIGAPMPKKMSLSFVRLGHATALRTLGVFADCLEDQAVPLLYLGAIHDFVIRTA